MNYNHFVVIYNDFKEPELQLYKLFKNKKISFLTLPF